MVDRSELVEEACHEAEAAGELQVLALNYDPRTNRFDVTLDQTTLWVGYALTALDVVGLRERTVQPGGVAPASIALEWSLAGADGTAATRDGGTIPDTATSRAARPLRALYVAPVVMTTPVAQTQRARLLAWLTAHPCVTDEQIAEGAAMNPSAARPRRRELVEAGLVRKVDMGGRTRAGRRAARWAVVGTVEEVVHGAD